MTDTSEYRLRRKYHADGRDRDGRVLIECFAVLAPDGSDTGIEMHTRNSRRHGITRRFYCEEGSFPTLAEALAAQASTGDDAA